MNEPLKGGIPLSEYIATLEQDPAHKLAMQEARRRLAQAHYVPGTPTYERLMRGEGPIPEPETQA
jgi:coproporphyrinogen III oxidase-like Fe-S oxidoreductase